MASKRIPRQLFTAVFSIVSLWLLLVEPCKANSITNRLGLIETNLGESASDCSQVEAECHNKWTSGSPVCGSDGKTYNNLCRLRQLVCRDKNVQFKHNGVCLAYERCPSQRATALRERNIKYGVYIPDCESDGSFKPMQCHQDTGFCWCVTPGGQTTGESATGNDITSLNCSKKPGERRGGYPTSEESPRRNSCPPNSRIPRCTTTQDSCSTSRRIVFQDNMVSLFLTEFMRQPEAKRHNEGEQKNVAIVWKFDQLDRNGDSSLGRKEYRDLRRLVRKSITPKSCAKDFPLLCDSNENKKVTLQEWTECWSSETILQSPQRPKPNRRGNKNKRKGGRRTERKKPDHNNIPKERKVRTSNCFIERERELNKAKGSSSTNSYFIPVCDGRGRFRPFQCYGSDENNAWFCWCVNVFSGKQLEGTSTKSNKNGTLNCNAMNLPTKVWPRCKSADDKRIFLNALTGYFNRRLRPEKKLSNEEIVERMFHKLDTNNNNKLNRKEIKKLQKKIIRSSVLKRCGRHIHRVCDANDDKAVYLKEWKSCLISSENNSREVHARHARLNPFIDILVSEE